MEWTVNPLYRDPEFAQFYDLENSWSEDFAFCHRLAQGCRAVLDLGCGTGLLAAGLAEGDQRRVVGVDAAPAMLELARQRPGGERVQWVRGDARGIRLGEHFDLVVLTGHVFQVFLAQEDQLAVLRTIANHLASEGRFVLERISGQFGA